MSTAKKRKSFDNFAGWTDEKIDDWIKERRRLDRKQKHLEQKIEEIRMTHRKRREDTTKIRYLYLKEHKLDMRSERCGSCGERYDAFSGPGIQQGKHTLCPRCFPPAFDDYHSGLWGAHDASVPGEGAFVNNVPVHGSTEDCLACILSR